jgi:nitroreductase
MDFFDVVKNRRSVRAYAGRPVEQEKLDSILQAAGQASADARPGKQRRNRFCRQLDSGRGIDPCFQPCRFGGDLGVFWSRRRLLLVRTWLPVR